MNSNHLRMERAIRLEIGAGQAPRIGYKSCDIRPLPHIDYVCTADRLPFENSTVDEIYSRHLIEHFTLKEFLNVLKEWNRVLKNEGEVYIICPNLIWHLKQITESAHSSFYNKQRGLNHRYWGFGSLFGWQQDEFDTHKFGYYFELLRDILTEFGFSQIKNLTNSGIGLENAPWHLEVRAQKTHEAPALEESMFFNHFQVKH